VLGNIHCFFLPGLYLGVSRTPPITLVRGPKNFRNFPSLLGPFTPPRHILWWIFLPMFFFCFFFFLPRIFFFSRPLSRGYYGACHLFFVFGFSDFRVFSSGPSILFFCLSASDYFCFPLPAFRVCSPEMDAPLVPDGFFFFFSLFFLFLVIA